MSEGVKLRISEEGATATAAGLAKIEQQLKKIDTAGQKTSTALEKVGVKGKKTSSVLRDTLTRDVGALTGVMGKFWAIAGGVGAGAAYSSILSFRKQLNDIRVAGRLSEDQMTKLKNRMEEVGNALNMDDDALIGIATKSQALRNDFGTTLDSMKEIASIGKAFGADLGETTAFSTVLQKKFGLAKDELKDAAGLLEAMGVLNAEKMSTMTPLLKHGAALGYTGMRGVTNIGGTAALAQKFGGMEEIDRFFSTFKSKSKLMSKAGINLFDKKTGETADVSSIMLQLMNKAGGSREKLYGFFGGRSRIVDAFVESYDPKKRQWKDQSDVQKFYNVKGNRSTIDEMLQLRGTGEGKSLENKKKIDKFVDTVVKDYGGKVLDYIEGNLTSVGVMLGAGLVAKKGFGLFKGISKGGGVGGKEGLASGVGGSGTPVFVVNWPGAGIGGGGLGGGAGLPTGGGPGGFMRGVGALDAIGMGVTALSTGLAVGTALDQSLGISDKIGASAGMSPEERMNKVLAYNDEESKKRLLDQAKMFADLSKGGVGTLNEGGNRTALTQGAALSRIQAQASKMGMSDSAFQALLPALKELTSAIKEQERPEWLVKTPQLDKVEVTRSRGRQRRGF